MALLIDNDVAERVLDVPEAVDAIEDAFTQLGHGDATFQPRTDLWSPTAETGDYYRWGNLLGAIRDPPRLALRFKSDIADWEEDADGNVRYDRYNMEPGTLMRVVLLFDTSTGELLGLLKDEVLQHVRVASTAGVACKHLARADATSVGMLGSGGMAKDYARAFAAVREIETIDVYSPTPEHRERYADLIGPELGVDVTPVDGAAAAIEGADIVASCTNARNPTFEADLIESGQFVVTVQNHEVSEEHYETVDRVFTTDNRSYLDYNIGAREDRDEVFPGPGSASGYTDRTDPTLDAVLTDESIGRQDPTESILYDNRSAGIQFAAVGNLVYKGAVQRGLGVEIPLEWFQQDVRN